MTDRLAELEATIRPYVFGPGVPALAELVEIARRQEGLLTEWSLFYPPLPSSNDANLRNRTLAALSPPAQEPTG